MAFVDEFISGSWDRPGPSQWMDTSARQNHSITLFLVVWLSLVPPSFLSYCFLHHPTAITFVGSQLTTPLWYCHNYTAHTHTHTRNVGYRREQQVPYSRRVYCYWSSWHTRSLSAKRRHIANEKEEANSERVTLLCICCCCFSPSLWASGFLSLLDES